MALKRQGQSVYQTLTKPVTDLRTMLAYYKLE